MLGSLTAGGYPEAGEYQIDHLEVGDYQIGYLDSAAMQSLR